MEKNLINHGGDLLPDQRMTTFSSSQSDVDQNVLTLQQKVTVTYHRFDIFKEIFTEYFLTQLTDFHKSLSPKYNRDMVFKAGEGAGRSGSFFFFSHDRKWIVKTMTD